ncbi:MAG TPA: type II toxin-antitoxin system RelE/ParE family toxin [Polyangia bacterium]
MIRLTVRPAAEGDLADAQTWYSSQDGVLADEFVDELRATLRRVREMPLQFPEVGGARRALLHRFSYTVYFVLPDDAHAIVVAILHQSRTPTIWKRRIQTGHTG